ncbi:MAG: spore germination protein, partial [Christensenellales bacterium]
LYGIVLFTVFLIAYLSGLDSFGAPYLAPYAPVITEDFKDGFIKDNLLNFEKRPYSIPNENRRRFRRNGR